MTKFYIGGLEIDGDKPPLSPRDPLEPERYVPPLRQRFLMAVLFLSFVGLAVIINHLLWGG